MSVAKVTEIISSSSKSFDDAVENGIKRASKTLKGITGAWVADQKVRAGLSKKGACTRRPFPKIVKPINLP